MLAFSLVGCWQRFGTEHAFCPGVVMPINSLSSESLGGTNGPARPEPGDTPNDFSATFGDLFSDSFADAATSAPDAGPGTTSKRPKSGEEDDAAGSGSRQETAGLVIATTVSVAMPQPSPIPPALFAAAKTTELPERRAGVSELGAVEGSNGAAGAGVSGLSGGTELVTPGARLQVPGEKVQVPGAGIQQTDARSTAYGWSENSETMPGAFGNEVPQDATTNLPIAGSALPAGPRVADVPAQIPVRRGSGDFAPTSEGTAGAVRGQDADSNVFGWTEDTSQAPGFVTAMESKPVGATAPMGGVEAVHAIEAATVQALPGSNAADASPTEGNEGTAGRPQVYGWSEDSAAAGNASEPAAAAIKGLPIEMPLQTLKGTPSSEAVAAPLGIRMMASGVLPVSSEEGANITPVSAQEGVEGAREMVKTNTGEGAEVALPVSSHAVAEGPGTIMEATDAGEALLFVSAAQGRNSAKPASPSLMGTRDPVRPAGINALTEGEPANLGTGETASLASSEAGSVTPSVSGSLASDTLRSGDVAGQRSVHALAGEPVAAAASGQDEAQDGSAFVLRSREVLRNHVVSAQRGDTVARSSGMAQPAPAERAGNDDDPVLSSNDPVLSSNDPVLSSNDPVRSPDIANRTADGRVNPRISIPAPEAAGNNAAVSSAPLAKESMRTLEGASVPSSDGEKKQDVTTPLAAGTVAASEETAPSVVASDAQPNSVATHPAQGEGSGSQAAGRPRSQATEAVSSSVSVPAEARSREIVPAPASGEVLPTSSHIFATAKAEASASRVDAVAAPAIAEDGSMAAPLTAASAEHANWMNQAQNAMPQKTDEAKAVPVDDVQSSGATTPAAERVRRSSDEATGGEPHQGVPVDASRTSASDAAAPMAAEPRGTPALTIAPVAVPLPVNGPVAGPVLGATDGNSVENIAGLAPNAAGDAAAGMEAGTNAAVTRAGAASATGANAAAPKAAALNAGTATAAGKGGRRGLATIAAEKSTANTPAGKATQSSGMDAGMHAPGDGQNAPPAMAVASVQDGPVQGTAVAANAHSALSGMVPAHAGEGAVGASAQGTARAQEPSVQARLAGAAEGHASASTAASPAQSTAGNTAINTAKLVQTMGQTEMRVGLRSAEFGDISIRTSATRDSLSAQISLDHAELARTLSAHLPEIQTRLGGREGLDVSVSAGERNAGGGTASDAGSQGSREQEQTTRHNTSRSFSAGFAEPAFLAGTTSAALQSSALSGRIDIRA